VVSDLRHPVIDGLRILLAAQTPAHVSDRELLGRFVARRDEEAFAAIVNRYSPMFMGVCRRVLNNADDADDACLATFLILVHKAATIRNTDSLAGWLHRVARRVAEDARAKRARRTTCPLPTEEIAARGDGGTEPMWREVRAALDEELQRLPDHYRAPLILCYLDGKTRDEAAQQLGWSLDVFRGWLSAAADLRGRWSARHRPVGRSAHRSPDPRRVGAAPVTLILTTIKYARIVAGLAQPPAFPRPSPNSFAEGCHAWSLSKSGLP
jgi:RNA polymerase sigma factor (sigma-70 family)